LVRVERLAEAQISGAIHGCDRVGAIGGQ